MSDHDSGRDSKGTPGNAPQDATNVAPGRRDFLRYAGFTFAAVSLPDFLSGCATQPGAAGEAIGTTRSAFSPVAVNNITSPWFTVVRRDDLLRLRFNFVQMTVSGNQIVPSSSQPGVILVEFPPQHIVEPTFPEPNTGAQPAGGTRPIAAQIAQPSRLAFYVPAGTAAMPLDLEALLAACTKLNLNAAANALPAADDTLPQQSVPGTSCGGSGTPCDSNLAIASITAMNRIRQVTDLQNDRIFPDTPPVTPPEAPTAAVADSELSIELPYRVVLSPSQAMRFAHSSTPVQSSTSNRTEIWSSRLARVSTTDGVSADETTRVPIGVRAVASRDLAGALDPFPTTPLPGQNALTSQNRLNIVDQSSNFTTPGLTYPIKANRLLLSARGGTLDSLAVFEDPKDGLLKWQHRASMGRDNYVRVEELGFLFPWGHKASLVTISERKFLANPNNAAGPRTAYLWTRQFVVILETFNSYGGLPLDCPFRQVKILTPSTPPIDPAPQGSYFWPTIGGYAVRLAAQIGDLEDNLITTNIAAIFVPSTTSPSLSLFETLQTEFQGAKDPNQLLRCASDFQRQRVAYAQTNKDTLGKTTFETLILNFGAFVRGSSDGSSSSSSSSGSPPPPTPEFSTVGGGDRESAFAPSVQTTQLAIASLRQFTGSDNPVTMKYPQLYLDNGFVNNNAGEVFLSLASGSPLSVDFGAESQRAGAFLTPSMSVLGLSRQIGPLAGNLASGSPDLTTQLQQLATGNADPSLVFGALASTKLFGCFSLSDLLPKPLPFPSMPSFVTHTLDVIATAVKTFNQVQVALDQIQSAASSFPADLQAALTSFESNVSSFAQIVANLPPPTNFVDQATTALKNIAGNFSTLQSTLASARAANAKLPSATRLSDSLFAQATSYLNAATAMLPAPPASFSSEITDGLNAIANAANVVANMSSQFTWGTSPGQIQSISLPSIPQIFFASPNTQLKITGEVRAHEVAGKPAGLDIVATLNAFDINLVGVGTTNTPYNTSASGNSTSSGTASPLAFLALSFDHLTFTAMAGQKPSIDVGFKDLTFQGPISFINGLKNIIPLDGFSDPPGITVDSQGIHGDFTLALPSLGLGVFSLENLSLGANFSIPFIGQPMTVGFHFSERQSPFHLTVSLLGGGGYFLMDLSLKDVVLIEAALEFGAQCSIDLVVASGSVSIMAGIYFRYDASATPPGVQLSGYVRIAGSMSVIGLITASVEMRLSLSYIQQGSQSCAQGEADISIEVSIMFFSASVDVHAEKTFGSNNGDPTFVEVMGTSGGSGSDWDTYCKAFAA